MNRHIYILSCVCIAFYFFPVVALEAATLRINPNTGVYTVGKQFTVTVGLNTDGKSVNAADGQISFNSRELQVVQINRNNSIFNLWTEEPAYSNTAGTISFGGGSPSGYKGTSGSIVSIVFRALGAGTPKLNFTSGSVLAADGLGTNILTSMSGATFTIAAETDSPAPEYIPPANTPQAPVITSLTHPDQTAWQRETTSKLSWKVPSDVVAVRTLLDSNPGSIPTIVYESQLSEKLLDSLPQGISYFHVQFKNASGWGRIAHYKLLIDSEPPQQFEISEDTASSTQGPKTLLFSYEDISPILEYKIQIDGKEPFIFKDETNSKKYTLDSISPGYHTVTVEAFDSAGNTAIASHSFTIDAFEKPKFTDVPSRINTGVVPVFKGITVPNATVFIEIQNTSNGTVFTSSPNSENDAYKIMADESGVFVFIPDNAFERGVYTILAYAQDSYGRMSERSDESRFVVEEPGYIMLGNVVINVLSVLIPLVALGVLLIFGTWYLWNKLVRWKQRVQKETKEAEESLKRELHLLMTNLHKNVDVLKEFKKGKLSKQESDLITQIELDAKHALTKVGKEIEDIEDSIM